MDSWNDVLKENCSQWHRDLLEENAGNLYCYLDNFTKVTEVLKFSTGRLKSEITLTKLKGASA